MRRILSALLLMMILCACRENDPLAPAMQLRTALLEADGCQFVAVITADYGENIYSFSLDCVADSVGNIAFTVISPESISGISGRIDAEGGALTFDSEILAFPIVADGYITPVSLPWLFVRTLQGGYIKAGGNDGEFYKVQMDDSYEEDPMTIDIWLDDKNLPIHCDLLWDNRRILSAEIKSFALL